ncbi:MAG TPA: FAD-binding oxidoreductase [Aeromicrobium sp.]|nr:FAD-binding oxidoreductase [Aeromicrobium sp.]
MTEQFEPKWRSTPPAEGTYREVLMFDPKSTSHPSAGWVKMFLEEFEIKPEDFRPDFPDGDQPISVQQRPALAETHRAALAAIVGVENAVDDDVSRVRYGLGKSLDEDIDLRRGHTPLLPDLVIHPRHKQDVAEVVAYCHENRIPIVPFGGGSSVVLGTKANEGGVVLVLTTHMNQIVEVNELNQTVTVQAGMLGPAYEAELNDAKNLHGSAHNYTGGHFPQSFHLATVGGWIAALGSGQASTYYGDAYDLVLAQEYVTPVGVISTKHFPATASGPKVNDILKGSEGTFGVLTELTLKIYRHQPENTARFALMMPTWEAAVDAAREITQGEFGKPAVLRISDPEETERALALKGFDGGLAQKYLTSRKMLPGGRCLLLGNAEGEKKFAAHVAKSALAVGRAHGGINLTAMATKAWERGRYSDVHVRNDIVDFSMIIDTFETSVTWDNLHDVHSNVRKLIKARPGTVCMTHASHFYSAGTNLYFILILKPQSPEEYFEFRSKILASIIENGGSPSHHHGTGELTGPLMEEHLGTTQMNVLRALKEHFDPHHIMNPGWTLGFDTKVRK